MNTRSWQRVGAAAVLALSSAAVWAAPSAAAPSVVKVGQQAAVSGSGFDAGSVVTVRVTDPAGRVAMAAAVAGPKGELTYALIPGAAGRYQVQLLDASQRVLATAVVNAAPN